MSCIHENFQAHVLVHRIVPEGSPKSEVDAFSAEVTVHCAECGQQFEFIGLPMGVDLKGCTMSPDGLEARLAMRPSEHSGLILGGYVGPLKKLN